MKYAIYEHPRTRKFAFVLVPNTFAEGDELAAPIAEVRWFDSLTEAVAAVPDLLNRSDDEPLDEWDDLAAAVQQKRDTH